MRIIAGRWRGRRIRVPSVPGLRPSTDRVRETLFNWLAAELPDARCADLCAGSGVLGFEALSRGARHVTFVDRDRRALAHIRDTVAALDAAAEAACVRDDALRWVRRTGDEAGGKARFDVVFADPPYAAPLLDDLPAAIAASGLIAGGGLLYLEHATSRCPAIPRPLEVWREGRAGQTRFLLLRNPALPA